ncbi:helix-turn-helix domain-containing protein [Leucobacter luti]|uniref:helix-turn-helix transcriptional regulator n=1 Tax=Leucobacter luti TaxID=340320 RepID=UPI003D07FC86
MLHRGTELDELCCELEASLDRGDHARALAQLRRSGPAAWYRLPRERFRAILELILAGGGESSEFARHMLKFVSVADHRHLDLEQAAAIPDGDPCLTTMRLIARMMDLRLRGRAGAALSLVPELHEEAVKVHPMFDTRSGWNLLISAQCGATAMLAGEFRAALDYFAAAQSHVIVPSLLFFNRDAHVKSAIIHALFGDTEDAVIALGQAKRIPRTASWIEPIIDAHAALAEAILDHDFDRASLTLRALPLREVGEMWPFLVLGLHRQLLRSGRLLELSDRLATFENLGFPRIEGESFTGSVLPMSRTVVHLMRGDLASAERSIAAGDPEFVGTQLVSAAVAVARGRGQRALELARSSAAGTDGLRQLQLRRYGIMAHAHLTLGRRDQALETLHTLESIAGGSRGEDVPFLASEVHELATTAVPKWEGLEAPMKPVRPNLELPVPLTSREREVLHLLASGASRTEIAERLFISMNTLKTHLRGVYRKLDAPNRATAILRAERAGLL